MEFRLLGPIEVRSDGQTVDVGHAKQRSVLAVLLLEPGQVLSPSTLIDRVWGHSPPDGVLNVLYTYIARLRRELDRCAVPLARRSGGYLVEVDPAYVDVLRFRRLLELRPTSGRDRLSVLEELLGLWRGAPFEGTTSPWLLVTRSKLAEEKLAAVLERAELLLAEGRHAEVIAQSRELVAQHPLNERPVEQLMLALYRSGRAPEALDEYQQARQRLADLRGSDPGPHLRQLQYRVLRDDPALAPHPPDTSTSPPPAGLPRDVPGFVGRRAELARLDALLEAGSRRLVLISAVDGTAGVGKTALALHWAHRAKSHFPDGNLYADLRGYGEEPPAQPAEVLDSFLSTLGVPPMQIPVELGAKTALYRSLLDQRRLLVVLDNAVDAKQVRPLLPGSPSCAVVITSRNVLQGLVARERAHRISLDVLPIEDSVNLLAEFLGRDRTASSPQAARQLAMLCACLPVALCVAGERALTDPHRTLDALVEELLDRQRRLDLLDAGGDPETAVRSVFSWSYDALAPDVAAAFRLTGQHPGPNLDAPAAAALWGTETSDASRLLRTLNRAHLVEQIHSGRYQMHDLLRAYAVEQAYREDSDAYRDSALLRLVDYYTAHTASAMDIAFAFERHRRPEVAGPDNGPMPFAHAHAARTWLDLQQDNIIATVIHAAAHGWSTRAERLSATVSRYLYTAARFAEALTMYEHVLATARTHEHPHAEAAASLSLADFHFALGHIEQALACEERALALLIELRDRESEGRALYRIGLVRDLLGHRAKAREALDSSLAIAHETGDTAGEARALHGLGVAHRRWQRYDESRDYLSRALIVCREAKDQSGECRALSNLGLVNAYLGDFDAALDHARSALTLTREVQDYVGEGRALDDLGLIHAQMGRHMQALLHHEQAITACRAAADGRFEPRALNGLAEALHANGRHYEALARHHDALALAQCNGDLYEQARAHRGLAKAYDITGRDNEAGPHRRHATAIQAKIGLTEDGGPSELTPRL